MSHIFSCNILSILWVLHGSREHVSLSARVRSCMQLNGQWFCAFLDGHNLTNNWGWIAAPSATPLPDWQNQLSQRCNPSFSPLCERSPRLFVIGHCNRLPDTRRENLNGNTFHGPQVWDLFYRPGSFPWNPFHGDWPENDVERYLVDDGILFAAAATSKDGSVPPHPHPDS